SVDDQQSEIGGDKLVAAAAGVQFPAERPEFFDQRFFDEVVDVFGVGPERIDPCGIGFGAIGNFVEHSERLLYFRGRENADRLQSFGPGTVHGDLIRQETAIERKRALERVEVSIWLTFEASSPQPVVFALGHKAKAYYVADISADSHIRASCTHEFVSALALGRTVT